MKKQLFLAILSMLMCSNTYSYFPYSAITTAVPRESFLNFFWPKEMLQKTTATAIGQSDFVDTCPLPDLATKIGEAIWWMLQRPFVHLHRLQQGWKPEYNAPLYRDLAILGTAGTLYLLYCIYNHARWEKKKTPTPVPGVPLIGNN